MLGVKTGIMDNFDTTLWHQCHETGIDPGAGIGVDSKLFVSVSVSKPEIAGVTHPYHRLQNIALIFP